MRSVMEVMDWTAPATLLPNARASVESLPDHARPDSAFAVQVIPTTVSLNFRKLMYRMFVLVCITTCGKTATVNNTYWGNPGYSSTYSTAGQCSLTVKKCSPDICELRYWNFNAFLFLVNYFSIRFRLDFIDFEIADPDATAGTATSGTATQCLTDMFTVSGQSNNVPGICGTNTNQHSKLLNFKYFFYSNSVVYLNEISVPGHDTRN